MAAYFQSKSQSNSNSVGAAIEWASDGGRLSLLQVLSIWAVWWSSEVWPHLVWWWECSSSRVTMQKRLRGMGVLNMFTPLGMLRWESYRTRSSSLLSYLHWQQVDVAAASSKIWQKLVGDSCSSTMLVGDDWNMFYFSRNIGNVIIPIDEL